MSVKVGMLAAKLNEGFLFLVFDAQRSCQSMQIKFCEVVCAEVWQLFCRVTNVLVVSFLGKPKAVFLDASPRGHQVINV